MPPDVDDLLRSADLRVTRPRSAVLTAVHEHPHADTDTILGAAKQVLDLRLGWHALPLL